MHRSLLMSRFWDWLLDAIFGPRCDHCGAKLDPGDAYCGECQEPVDPAADGGRHG